MDTWRVVKSWGMPKANFLLRSSVFLTCCCIQGSTMWFCQRLMFSSLRALFRRSKSAPRVGVQHGLHHVGRQISTIFFSSSSQRCGTKEARVLLSALMRLASCNTFSSQDHAEAGFAKTGTAQFLASALFVLNTELQDTWQA